MKLPQCPYCGCKYNYSRVKKHMKCKEVQCKSCGKRFAVVYKKSALIMAALFFIAMIAFNTFYLFNSKSTTLLPNVIFTVAAIVLYICLVPLIVKYEKISGQDDPLEKLKKNRHRYKKQKNTSVEIAENPLKNTTFDK